MSIRSASQSSVIGNKSTSAQRSQRAGLGTIDIEWLVIGGGGAGGYDTAGGGGGAGGVLSASSSSNVARPSSRIELGVPITVTVGAGGARATVEPGNSGSDSVFGDLTAVGGGGGGGYGTPLIPTGMPSSFTATTGGSGGGACGRNYNQGAAGTYGTTSDASLAAKQGNRGGNWSGGYLAAANGAGGGGSGGAAADVSSYNMGHGGSGAANSITGSPVTRAGGGQAGGPWVPPSNPGVPWGGGRGSGPSDAAGDGVANTGSGGGGGHAGIYTGPNAAGGGGGSGVVILKWLTVEATAKIGSGLTTSETTDGAYTVLTCSAGSDTITWF